MKRKRDQAIYNLTKRLGREPKSFEIEEEEEIIRERRRRLRRTKAERLFLQTIHGKDITKPPESDFVPTPHAAPAWLKGK